MKKAIFEFVNFDTEDVIATSGFVPGPKPGPDPVPDPCDDVLHYYITSKNQLKPNGTPHQNKYVWTIQKYMNGKTVGDSYPVEDKKEPRNGWYPNEDGTGSFTCSTHTSWLN